MRRQRFSTDSRVRLLRHETRTKIEVDVDITVEVPTPEDRAAALGLHERIEDAVDDVMTEFKESQ